jgi:hypothetical protein
MKNLSPLARECIEAARLALIAARAEMLTTDAHSNVSEQELRERTAADIRRLADYSNRIVAGDDPPLEDLNKELRVMLNDQKHEHDDDSLNGVLVHMAVVAAEIRLILRGGL